MTPALEDQLFARFCRTGDPAALAEVFDRTAPELLRVAAHVSGDAQAAEDLVQATFLAALESARQWDHSRRLLPWLVGILTHRAQTLRRQERRVPDRERVPREVVLDPVDEAQRAETWRELDRAIRALPGIYQTPLVLHLRHGLNAGEIAEAMRRPAGTVRAQLSRGMEMLRKALPVGIVLALVPIRGLASVRAVVLARAEALGASVGWSAAGAVVGGVLLMKKTLVAVAVVLVAVTTFVFWPGAPAPGAETVDAGSRGAGAVRTPAASRAVPGPAVAREVERVAVAASARAPSLLVRARFADGTPAADVVVTVAPARASTLDPRERSARGAADGIARFDALAPGNWLVAGDRGGSVPVQVGAIGDTACELVIPRGLTVRGHVRDEQQVPIAGAHVWVSRQWLSGSIVTHTAADGAFVLRDVAPDRQVSACADGFAPARCRVVIGQPGETLDVELVLTRSDVILTGLVQNRLGRGIAGARVHVGEQIGGLGGEVDLAFPDPNRSRPLWSPPPVLEVRTDAQGRFRIAGLIVPDGPLAAAVVADGFAPWTGAWSLRKVGAQDEVKVTLLRGATVRGVARDAEGHPLAQVSVRATLEGGISPGGVETGAEGSFVFEHLLGETLQLGARKRGVGSAHTTLTLRDEVELRWDPVLGGGPYLIGRVIDAQGQPLKGWRVGAWTGNWTRPQALFDTDAAGAFRIPECREPRYTLAAFDPAAPLLPMQAVATLTEVQPGSGPHLLVVEADKRPTGTITALVVDGDGAPIVGATACVQRQGGDSFITEQTDATGRYGSYLLLPGTYDLTVQAADHNEHRQAAIQVAPRATRDLGTIRLERAGTVLATVRGADPQKAHTGLRLLDGAGMSRHGFERQEDGTWRARGVPAGHYTAVLWPEDGAVTRVPVEVARGATVRVELNVEPGIPCRFTFAGVNDPAARWHIDWKTGTGEWLEQSVRTRFTGALTRRFTPGIWSVEIRAEDGRTARKEFTVTPADRELDVPVPVPAPAR